MKLPPPDDGAAGAPVLTSGDGADELDEPDEPPMPKMVKARAAACAAAANLPVEAGCGEAVADMGRFLPASAVVASPPPPPPSRGAGAGVGAGAGARTRAPGAVPDGISGGCSATVGDAAVEEPEAALTCISVDGGVSGPLGIAPPSSCSCSPSSTAASDAPMPSAPALVPAHACPT